MKLNTMNTRHYTIAVFFIYFAYNIDLQFDIYLNCTHRHQIGLSLTRAEIFFSWILFEILPNGSITFFLHEYHCGMTGHQAPMQCIMNILSCYLNTKRFDESALRRNHPILWRKTWKASNYFSKVQEGESIIFYNSRRVDWLCYHTIFECNKQFMLSGPMVKLLNHMFWDYVKSKAREMLKTLKCW